jgi:hypothetical protein
MEDSQEQNFEFLVGMGMCIEWSESMVVPPIIAWQVRSLTPICNTVGKTKEVIMPNPLLPMADEVVSVSLTDAALNDIMALRYAVLGLLDSSQTSYFQIPKLVDAVFGKHTPPANTHHSFYW